MTLRAAVVFALGAISASLLPAQTAISLHSGLIQFTSGDVQLDGQRIQKTTTNLPEIKRGNVFSTGADGAAEVLLTPGVFVRMKSNSSIRMDNNLLSDTRVALLSGAVMVECDELIEGNSVMLSVGTRTVELRKGVLFRLESSPAKLMVDRGQAFVVNPSEASALTVKQGKQVDLSDALPQVAAYRTNKKDELYQFSQARSADSAYATGVVSRSLFNDYNTCSGASNWYLMNPVGMYAYLPCNGIYRNGFGNYFYGLNYGFMYDGPLYYLPPPVLVYGSAIVATNGVGGTGTGFAAGGVGGSGNGGNGKPRATPGPRTVSTASNTVTVPVFGGAYAPRSLELSRAAFSSGGSSSSATGRSSAPSGFSGATSLGNVHAPAMRSYSAPAAAPPYSGGFGGGAAARSVGSMPAAASSSGTKSK